MCCRRDYSKNSSEWGGARGVQGWKDTIPPWPTRNAEQEQWGWWWSGSAADQLARRVPRVHSCSLSSQNLSSQRNFRISQVRQFITEFKPQSFILITSCNLPPKPVSALQNFFPENISWCAFVPYIMLLFQGINIQRCNRLLGHSNLRKLGFPHTRWQSYLAGRSSLHLSSV